MTETKKKEDEIQELRNKIKEMLKLMNISKAVIIDDKIGKDECLESVLQILQGDFDNEEFDIRDVLQKAEIDIDEQKEKAEHGEINRKVIEIFLKEFPERQGLFESEINLLISVLKEIFGKDKTITYSTTAEVQEQGLGEDTILFLDYKLDGASPRMSQNLVRVLSEQNGQPKCIVFISKDPIFFLNEKQFSMANPIEKGKYFREIKKLQAETNYKNSLYDFIGKSCIDDKTKTYQAILEALQNLHGGKIFFELLEMIDNVLIESSQKVLDKFYLLNARSLQELLNSKIENEGLAKPAFLMEWISRQIAKTVTRNDTIIKEIYGKLKNIGESKYLINEFHEDITLREIVRSEMWDTSLNKRYEPIDFGDVFLMECNGVNRRAILMTQPCTLAVRKSGNRASKTGMLVWEKEIKKGAKNRNSQSPRDVILNDWNDGDISFSLDDTITFPLDILDLTTLNDDGSAKIMAVNGTKEIKLPEEFWANGYRDRMNSLTRDLVSQAETRKFGGEFGFMPIEQSWLQYKINSKENCTIYSFPIKRLAKLDYQYAMHLFQKAQSWWGRIGLPVQLNFIDDYEPNLGAIKLNNKNYPVNIYKKQGNETDITDICIDLEELSGIIMDIHRDNIEIIECVKKVFSDNRAIKFNCASGKRLLSLKESKEGIQYFATYGIFIKLNTEEQNDVNNVAVVVKHPYLTKCYFNNIDVTEEIFSIKFTSTGELRCDIPFKLIKECKCFDKLSNMVLDKAGAKVLKYSEEKLKEFFNTRIEENELYIEEYDQQIETEKQVAALK